MDTATQSRICNQASEHVRKSQTQGDLRFSYRNNRRTKNVDSWVITNCHLLVFNAKHLNGRLF